MTGEQYFFIAALALTLTAAITDWRTGHIPNWLTLGAIGAAPLAHGVVAYGQGSGDQAMSEFGFSFLGIVVCGAVPWLLHKWGGIMGGDVKLLAALGAVLMVHVGLQAEMYAFISAAIIAMAKMAYDGRLVAVFGNSLALVANPVLPKGRRRPLSNEMLTEMRFGPPAFVGVCVCLLENWRGWL